MWKIQIKLMEVERFVFEMYQRSGKNIMGWNALEAIRWKNCLYLENWCTDMIQWQHVREKKIGWQNKSNDEINGEWYRDGYCSTTKFENSVPIFQWCDWRWWIFSIWIFRSGYFMSKGRDTYTKWQTWNWDRNSLQNNYWEKRCKRWNRFKNKIFNMMRGVFLFVSISISSLQISSQQLHLQFSFQGWPRHHDFN